MLGGMKIGLFGFLVASLLAAVMKGLAWRRAARLEGHGGCVACGSKQLQRDGDINHCGACGYSGRADGGGKLSAKEIGSLYAPTKDPHDGHPW